MFHRAAAAHHGVSALMTYLQRLARTEMATFLALLFLAGGVGSVSALVSGFAETAAVGAGDSFGIVFAGTLAFGAVPALLIGAPGYAWMWHVGRASWLTAVVLGAALGAPWFIVAGELGAWATAAGAFVAIITHAVCRMGANQSFKPTPSARLN